MHCIKLNDLSQQRTFPIINDTEYKCESVFIADIKMVENESECVVNMKVL